MLQLSHSICVLSKGEQFPQHHFKVKMGKRNEIIVLIFFPWLEYFEYSIHTMIRLSLGREQENPNIFYSARQSSELYQYWTLCRDRLQKGKYFVHRPKYFCNIFHHWFPSKSIKSHPTCSHQMHQAGWMLKCGGHLKRTGIDIF